MNSSGLALGKPGKMKDKNTDGQEAKWFIGQNLADTHLLDFTITHHS